MKLRLAKTKSGGIAVELNVYYLGSYRSVTPVTENSVMEIWSLVLFPFTGV